MGKEHRSVCARLLCDWLDGCRCVVGDDYGRGLAAARAIGRCVLTVFVARWPMDLVRATLKANIAAGIALADRVAARVHHHVPLGRLT